MESSISYIIAIFSLDRSVPMNQFDILDRACALLLARADDNGNVNYADALKEMRNKKEFKNYTNQKGLLEVIAELNRLHFVSHVKWDENLSWSGVSDDTEFKLVLKERKWKAPEIRCKRRWDDTIDRNVKMRFERMGLRLL